MKNHLKHRPYLRFVDAPSAEAGGDATSAQETTAAAAEDTACWMLSPRQVPLA